MDLEEHKAFSPWRPGACYCSYCAENANDSKAGEEKTLNEFQHVNVLQVPNCMNLRSLAIRYLLNNSIYFILQILLGKSE